MNGMIPQLDRCFTPLFFNMISAQAGFCLNVFYALFISQYAILQMSALRFMNYFTDVVIHQDTVKMTPFLNNFSVNLYFKNYIYTTQ